ncbi:MAG: ATP-dependent 6-phosphofructokinase, partial [Fibrobacter sp.]|nr:ATP-dependent 6-phosphofructokinase [Fibrobacter sp.]
MTQDDIIKNPLDYDLSIETVGKGTLKSPMNGVPFVSENDKISLTTDINLISEYIAKGIPVPSLESAGPREIIFHDPAWTRAGIVTCGGLCPGLNNVIKGLVQVLWFDYGVKNIFGIPYGYRGLNPNYGYSPIVLDPDVVDAIQEDGGTILGSSRGMQDPSVMVDTLMRLNINVLFCIGGDGTLRGAHAIAEEVKKRKQPISIIGIPKTIDNDLNLIDRTFGFETAVLSATDVITSAHIEANGAYNGLGLVKLMGRDSGFIAAYASLATTVVNFCLVPEVPFELEGESGLFKALESRYASGKTHAVIAVA